MTYLSTTNRWRPPGKLSSTLLWPPPCYFSWPCPTNGILKLDFLSPYHAQNPKNPPTGSFYLGRSFCSLLDYQTNPPYQPPHLHRRGDLHPLEPNRLL